MRSAGALGALALLTSLGGCVIYDVDGRETTTVHQTQGLHASTPPLEALHGIQFAGNRMTVMAPSNGCTQISNFEVQIENGDPARISLVRREADVCRAHVPGGVSLSWTYEELGLTSGQSVQVLNPLIV